MAEPVTQIPSGARLRTNNGHFANGAMGHFQTHALQLNNFITLTPGGSDA